MDNLEEFDLGFLLEESKEEVQRQLQDVTNELSAARKEIIEQDRIYKENVGKLHYLLTMAYQERDEARYLLRIMLAGPLPEWRHRPQVAQAPPVPPVPIEGYIAQTQYQARAQTRTHTQTQPMYNVQTQAQAQAQTQPMGYNVQAQAQTQPMGYNVQDQAQAQAQTQPMGYNVQAEAQAQAQAQPMGMASHTLQEPDISEYMDFGGGASASSGVMPDAQC